MNRSGYILGAALALGVGLMPTQPSWAQSPPVTPQPSIMPGVTVGTMPAGSGVRPVGVQLPKAVPNVGTPVAGGRLPGTVPTIGPGAGNQPVTPQGQQIDLKNVVAPYPNMPKELTFWDKLEERWFNMFKPDPLPITQNNWTPGLARRNKERREARERKWWME